MFPREPAFRIPYAVGDVEGPRGSGQEFSEESKYPLPIHKLFAESDSLARGFEQPMLLLPTSANHVLSPDWEKLVRTRSI